MNDRRHLLMIAGLAVALLAAVLWSYGRLAAARDGAAASAENLDKCRELAARVESLRRRPSVAGSRELREAELTSRIEQAAGEAEFDEGAVDRIEPQPARRLGDGLYRETPTSLRLNGVTLQQLFTFLHALGAADASGLHLRDIHLTAPRGGEAAGDQWDVDATLAQLVYAPEARASGGAASGRRE